MIREYCSNPECTNHLEGGHTPICRMCHIEKMANEGFVLVPAANCAETGAWVYVEPYQVGLKVRIDFHGLPGQAGRIARHCYKSDYLRYEVLMIDGSIQSVNHFQLKVVG